MKIKNLSVEPHVVFFPLAVTGSFTSVAVWSFAFLIQKGWVADGRILSGYPASVHSEQILALFFLPAISGFIFSAYGQLEQNVYPHRTILGVLAAALALFPLSYAQNRMPMYLA